ncbi:MAG: lysophospholipid acyltransferase family protein [Muricomes sp.]
MIAGEKREEVISNIRRAVENGEFHCKVEVDDPFLTPEQKHSLLQRYVKKRKAWRFQVNTWIARCIANTASKKINGRTKVTGLKNIKGISGGAILTSNHFSPLDNTVLRTLALKMGKKKLCIVSHENNFAMSGWIGYFMNYTDTFPISEDKNYMTEHFEPLLQSFLEKKNLVLIYPEQEMWFNYRKPRPLKRGAYYYAAKFGVPVISCFIEIRNRNKLDIPGFYKVQYILHILPAIFPDPAKTIRENSLAMCEQDYRQKKGAYEKAYQKPLDYHFEPDDIAGWVSTPY